MGLTPAARDRVRRMTEVMAAMVGLGVGLGGHSTTLYWETVCQPY